jgi:hypothetical protein
MQYRSVIGLARVDFCNEREDDLETSGFQGVLINFIFCVVTLCIPVGGYQSMTSVQIFPLSFGLTAKTNEALRPGT